ncbi:MAG: hypothetical protein MAG715_00103 [Methanonatronarchaeales archaeon]|nr:hypothetical protein [Methanonatronarchaeales archaeon]
MRPESAKGAVDAIRDSDYLRIHASPYPSAVLTAAMLVRGLRELGKLFHVSFRDAFDSPDGGLRLETGDHEPIYRALMELGVELPEFAVAASACGTKVPRTEILEEAVARGTLTLEEGLYFTGEVGNVLESGVNPLISGMAGDSIETSSVLKGLGIDLGITFGELDGYERTRLASFLACRLVEQGASAASIDLMLMGRGTGSAGCVTDLLTVAEAQCHLHAPSRALSGLLGNVSRGEDEEAFGRAVVDAISAGTEGERVRIRRVEKGPALKVAKVMARDLYADFPVVVDGGDTVYCANVEEAILRGLAGVRLERGEGWFAAGGVEAEDVVEAVRDAR